MTSTSPCPFCGDIRPAQVEEVEMKYDPPNLFVAACQCCGAQGPSAITRGAAIVMWDERRAPGETRAFTDLADKLAGHITHGIDCPKSPHRVAGGYEHGEDDDGPYFVDGVKYCGRCHIYRP